MSYDQPDGWGQRATITEPAVDHQIRIVTQSRTHWIAVTCVCLLRSNGPAIGVLPATGDPFAIYAQHHTADGAA